MPHRRGHTEPPHLQLEWVPSIVLPAQQVQTQQLRQNLVAKAPLHHQNHQMSWAQMDIPWQRMALGSKRIQRGYIMMFSGHWISNKILQHRLPCQQHRPGKATASYKQNMKYTKECMRCMRQVLQLLWDFWRRHHFLRSLKVWRLTLATFKVAISYQETEVAAAALLVLR